MKRYGGWTIAALALFGVLTLSLWFFSNQVNRLALVSDAGFLERGSMFGVTIGSPVGEIESAVRQYGFKPYKIGVRDTCLHHDYERSIRINVYTDDTWRRGTLCIAYNNSTHRVTAIEWSYAAFIVEL